jgi:hypothetical protein
MALCPRRFGARGAARAWKHSLNSMSPTRPAYAGQQVVVVTKIDDHFFIDF